ncbi:hypothetical protein FE634_20890 [Nocardioides dongxiaopingii]|uniref:DUF6891 domain-containing protein n=1 Tax=Nocardioides sp. S-1144 TaxID=2582905 RepID=UPI00110E1E6A|nr:hypothetical protein [Nocardioides sp. S-1144]QCW52270.1 hypothetical protein FE634_20890 [Nocardioides sp. S-1144]
MPRSLPQVPGLTVARFEGWYAGADLPEGPPPRVAGRVLGELFARAQRGGGDLHDPTAELLRWLLRDVVRDGIDPGDDYDLVLMTLVRYLLFLRRTERWRRSERAVQDCWDVTTWGTQPPLGLGSLGPTVDESFATGLAAVPSAHDVLGAGAARPFLGFLRATLDVLGTGPSLPRSAAARLVGLADGTVALRLWVDALHETGLVRVDGGGQVLEARGEVRDAGGCPPPSADLVDLVVMGLVRAAVDSAFDAALRSDDQRRPLAAAAALAVALVAGCDESYLLAEDEDDEEESTASVVTQMAEAMLGDDAAGLAPVTAEVMRTLDALASLGLLDDVVLERGSHVLLVPEALRHRVIRTLSDHLGVVGTDDTAVVWAPVDLPSTLPEGAGVELTAALGGVDVVRLRVGAATSLGDLHRVVSFALRRPVARRHVYCHVDGVRRFTGTSWLRSFEERDDAEVTDDGAAAVGAVLAEPGAELDLVLDGTPVPVRLRVGAVLATAPATAVVVGPDGAEEPLAARHAVLDARLPPGSGLARHLLVLAATGRHDHAGLVGVALDLVTADDFGRRFPGERRPTQGEAVALVEEVVAEHRRLVPRASPGAQALLRALTTLPGRGVAVFLAGHTWTPASSPLGHVATTAREEARAILTDEVTLTYGGADRSDDAAAERVGRILAEALTEAGLDVDWDGDPRWPVVVTPLRWEWPFGVPLD